MRRIITYKRDDGSVISSSSITLERSPYGRHYDSLVYRVVHVRNLLTWREPFTDDTVVEYSQSLAFALRQADEYARKTERMEVR